MDMIYGVAGEARKQQQRETTTKRNKFWESIKTEQKKYIIQKKQPVEREKWKSVKT